MNAFDHMPTSITPTSRDHAKRQRPYAGELRDADLFNLGESWDQVTAQRWIEEEVAGLRADERRILDEGILSVLAELRPARMEAK
jgi:hypothetical protein